MSLKYLYICQKPEDFHTVTVYNTTHAMPGLQHVKYMIPHISTNPFDTIQIYLTSNSVMYVPSKVHSRDPSIISAQQYIMQGKYMPIHKFYLASIPLQADVLMKLYTKVNTTTHDHVISNLNSSIDAIISRIDDIDNNAKKNATSEIIADIDKKMRDRDHHYESIIGNMATDISLLSLDNTLLKTELSSLRSEIELLRAEMGTLRVDLDHRHYIKDNYFDDTSTEDETTDGTDGQSPTVEQNDQKPDDQPIAESNNQEPEDQKNDTPEDQNSQDDVQLKRSWLWF